MEEKLIEVETPAPPFPAKGLHPLPPAAPAPPPPPVPKAGTQVLPLPPGLP